MKKRFAAIFDMDGVIVQNDEFHCRAWQVFCSEHGMQVSFEEVKSWFGNTNATILKNLFNDPGESDIREMAARKEKIYRGIYAPEIRPVNGLKEFLEELAVNDIPIALATAAPMENVEFVLDKTGTGKYFRVIVDESKVSTGKPSPEIFLKAAEELEWDPSLCVVFEDSFHGIMAGNNAGMKVVGIATSHEIEKLMNTVMNINDFSEIDISIMKRLFN